MQARGTDWVARSNGRGQIARSPTVKPLGFSYLSDLASSYPPRLPLECCAVGSQKMTHIFGRSANYSQMIEGSAVPLQLRWRPLAAAEAGAAASGAAGMPVRWPRRPAAVSEAVAAGAGPDFSCAAGQKRAAKPPIGEVRSLSVVCVCVSGSVGRVWSCGRSSPVLVVWGGSPASGWLVFSIFPAKEKNLCRRFFRVRLPIWGPVRVPVGMSPPSSIPSFVMFRCLRRRRPGSRATCNRCGVYAHVWWLITRASSGCAVRCFRCLLRWRVLVALIKETGVFVRLRLRLRQDARHRRPPPTPATDARHRRPPPTPARSHDSSRNPRAMPGVVPEFPSKHPRQTAVVLTAKRGRAAFCRVSQ